MSCCLRLLIDSQSEMKGVYTSIPLQILGVNFGPFLDKRKKIFATTIKSLSDENSLNQFYILISAVEIYYILFLCDFSLPF